MIYEITTFNMSKQIRDCFKIYGGRKTLWRMPIRLEPAEEVTSELKAKSNEIIQNEVWSQGVRKKWNRGLKWDGG